MPRSTDAQEAAAGTLVLVPASKLRPRDAVTLLRVISWYAVIRLTLAVRGFAGLSRLLGLAPLADAEREPGTFPMIGPRTRRAVRGAQRVMAVKALGVTCIPRAVVLERMLTSHGVAADLVIGVLTDQGFRAHAWLEIEGNVIGINETGSKTWRTIARFRSARSSRIAASR